LEASINKVLKDFVLQLGKQKRESAGGLAFLNTMNRVCWSSVYAYNIDW
jgi:hypothetical protein